MKNDLQRATVSKRVFAFLLDFILASILIAGLYVLLAAVLRPNEYQKRYTEILSSYEERYGVSFDTSQEAFDAMSEEEKENYRNAVDAMNADSEANRAITTAYRRTLIIFVTGILTSLLILEFVVPLFLGDGRTLGKRLFGVGVMRRTGIRVNATTLFVRSVIGKGVLEIIFPILILILSVSGITGFFGILLLAVLMIVQIAVYMRSGEGILLHDLLSNTVTVDWASQRIFADEAARDAYLSSGAEEEKQNRIY